jgi:hypothetical protein
MPGASQSGRLFPPRKHNQYCKQPAPWYCDIEPCVTGAPLLGAPVFISEWVITPLPRGQGERCFSREVG